MDRIFLSPPDMRGNERDYLLRAFDSNWITTLGPEVEGLESDLVTYCGAESALALVSGTAALHLALLVSGVEPGDEVWVSSFTFVAPANAVRYVGADLRFVDSERETWNMDPDLLAEALADAARKGWLPAAVVVVDLYGQCAQLDRLTRTCAEYGVTLIEDAAEAIGATWQGRQAGTWGRFGAYSFNGNKIITTGGGGALVGSSEEVERARYLSQQARQPVLHYEHDDVGFNYRMSNLLAGVGRGQLEDLDEKIERCREINSRYRAGLGPELGVSFMPWDERGAPNGWLTVITLDEGCPRSPLELCGDLAAGGVEARPAWKPMHLQPVFEGVPVVGGSVCTRLFESGVCLPSGSGLSDSDQDRVIELVASSLR